MTETVPAWLWESALLRGGLSRAALVAVGALYVHGRPQVDPATGAQRIYRAWSREAWAKAAGCSLRQLQEALPALELAGVITIHPAVKKNHPDGFTAPLTEPKVKAETAPLDRRFPHPSQTRGPAVSAPRGWMDGAGIPDHLERSLDQDLSTTTHRVRAYTRDELEFLAWLSEKGVNTPEEWLDEFGRELLVEVWYELEDSTPASVRNYAGLFRTRAEAAKRRNQRARELAEWRDRKPVADAL